MKKTIFLIITTLSIFSVAATEKKSIFIQALNKYSNAAAVKSQFIKTDIKKTLGINKTSKGEMIYAKGKINISVTPVNEKKSEIIYDGKNLWIVEYPDLDFDPKGKRKVTEIKDHKPALAEQIVGLFKNPEQFLKTFKVSSDTSDGKMNKVKFESKDKAIQNFEIELNSYKLLINAIQFTDDVQTETRIEFTQTEFLKKAPKNIFEYKRKKDDEVM
jgi:outer membrane lipoprotein-sorting protein